LQEMLDNVLFCCVEWHATIDLAQNQINKNEY
jgi:hypothetical protein